MDPIEALRLRLAELAAQMNALTGAAAAIGKPMSEEEQTKFNALDAEIRRIEASIQALERNESVQNAVLGRPQARKTEPGDGDGPRITGGTPNAWNAADHNFKRGIGEYFAAVRQASYGRADERLQIRAAVTSWSGSQDPASVGYALPPQFVDGIMSQVMPGDSFLGALNPIPSDSDLINITTDEDAPWASTGITAAKTAEGVAITASKAATKRISIVMYGVKSLVHVDERTLRNLSFMGSYVQRKMAEKIRWKLENYVINGSGEGEPLGIRNAPGLNAIADTASTATLIAAEDLGLMLDSALNGGGGGFWIAHPLITNQVRFAKTGTSGYPIYTADIRGGAEVEQLLSKRFYKSEACPALNSTGDILFVQPSGYLLALEAGGIQQATTIAFAFDQGLESFRSTLYMGGAPTLSAKVLRADGANYVSNLVALTGGRS